MTTAVSLVNNLELLLMCFHVCCMPFPQECEHHERGNLLDLFTALCAASRIVLTLADMQLILWNLKASKMALAAAWKKA